MSITHTHGTRFAIRQVSQQDFNDLPQQALSAVSCEGLTTVVSAQSKINMNKTVSSSRKEKNMVKNNSKQKIMNKNGPKSITPASTALTKTSSSIIKDNLPSLQTHVAANIVSESSTVSTATSSSLQNNPAVQFLSTTDSVGLKNVSNMVPRTSSVNVNQLVLDFQVKLKAKDEIIKNLKNELKESEKKIVDIQESSMVIPSEPLVIDWIDHLYESVHKEKFRIQVDYADYAKKLTMDEQTLRNCIIKNDRIKTARNIVRNFSDYEELLNLDNAWQCIDKDKINLVLDFIRKLFGPSITITDNMVRTSIASMIRITRWKIRGQDIDGDPDNNVPQLVVIEDAQDGNDKDHQE